MVQIPTQASTLEAFLQLPETKPASNFFHGKSTQKPMPQGEHSTLQGRLTACINGIGIPNKTFHAYPELRCTFGGVSIVPDISVFRWQRIPLSPSGRVANRFDIHPDWAIEILSPDQSMNTRLAAKLGWSPRCAGAPTLKNNNSKVLNHLLHCSQHGTALGWLLIPADEEIYVVLPESRLKLYQGEEVLPMLPELPLSLSPSQMFDWLRLS